MVAVPYLQPDEYAAYGIPDGTAAQVSAACSLANTYLQRPEGLIWAPDAGGLPAYMANKPATMSCTLAAPVVAGIDVSVTIAGGRFGPQTIGEVVILDRSDADLVEACVITATSGSSLTFAAVRFDHAAGAAADFGLTIFEELPVPSRRSTVRLSRTPAAQLLSGLGRYGSGRRSQQFAAPNIDTNLLAYAGAFGGPPAWTPFPVADADINQNTGEVWIPPGLLLAYFSDVRLHYVAGWPQANLPSDVKQAVANLVRQGIDNPIAGNIKQLKAGDATIQRFGASALDDDTKALLQPYRALLMA